MLFVPSLYCNHAKKDLDSGMIEVSSSASADPLSAPCDCQAGGSQIMSTCLAAFGVRAGKCSWFHGSWLMKAAPHRQGWHLPLALSQQVGKLEERMVGALSHSMAPM